MEMEESHIDHAKILEITGNDQAAAQRLLNMFIEELQVTLVLIKTAHDQASYLEIGRLAHRMHGAAGYFGVPVLCKLLKDIEAAVKHEKYAVVDQLLPDFYQGAEQVLVHAKEFL